jgi:hypothetical protein
MRGVREKAPPPTSELEMTNPAQTVGLSAPSCPVKGER